MYLENSPYQRDQLINIDQVIGRALDRGVDLGEDHHQTIEKYVSLNLIPRLLNGEFPATVVDRLVSIDKFIKEGKTLDEIQKIIKEERRKFLKQPLDLPSLVDTYKKASKSLLMLSALAIVVYLGAVGLSSSSNPIAHEVVGKPVGNVLAAFIRQAKDADANSTDPLGITNISEVIKVNEKKEIIIEKQIIQIGEGEKTSINLDADKVDGADAGTSAGNVLLLDQFGDINITGNITIEGVLTGDGSGLTNLPISKIENLSLNSLGNIDLIAGSGVSISTNESLGTITFSLTSLPSTDASTLDTIDSSQFLRSDTTDSFTSGTLTFDAATTLSVLGTFSCTNCIGDTAIPDTLTASNYLPLSGGTLTSNLDIDGHVAIGSSASISTSDVLTINEVNSDAYISGIDLTINSTTATPVPTIHGINLISQYSGSGGTAVLTGVEALVTQNSAASVLTMYGFRSRLSSAAATGTISTAYNFHAGSPTFSGGDPTDIYGILINNQGNAGTTNSYGIYLAGISGSTNNYALYLAGASGAARDGITFGPADTNLYRSAANVLKTDDALTVTNLLTATGGYSAAAASNITYSSGVSSDPLTINGTITGTGVYMTGINLDINNGGNGVGQPLAEGINVNVQYTADDVGTNVYGIRTIANFNPSNVATAVDLIGISAQVLCCGTGGLAPTNIAAIRIDVPTIGAGTSTGLQIEDQSTNYAIRTLGSSVSTFGGKVSISTNSTSAVGFNLNTAQAAPSCASLSNGDFGYDSTNNRIYWKGTGGTCSYWNRTGTFDIAERAAASENLEDGDVLAIDTSANDFMVKKSSNSYQKTLLGIQSSDPTFIDNPDSLGKPQHIAKLALAGRVPTKVSIENGPIEVGDYLTSSSIPGVAMRATQSGPVIGKALQNFNQTGVGKVLVLVSSNYYTKPISRTDGASITTESIVLGKNQIKLNSNGEIVFEGSININGDVRISKTLFADKIETNQLKVSKLNIDSSSDSSGSATIASGETKVVVKTGSVTGSSRVLVTPNNFTDNQVLVVTQKLSGNSFVVEIQQPIGHSISFDWWVVN